ANGAMRDNSFTVQKLRERHVLTLVALGRTVDEIAEDEGKSPATIRTQLASARKQLGARNTTHCVSLALSLGLISIER
ncbi:MAG: helix-turn-helix transcriptional regulator, partial [Pseudomonadota bacterium]